MYTRRSAELRRCGICIAMNQLIVVLRMACLLIVCSAFLSPTSIKYTTKRLQLHQHEVPQNDQERLISNAVRNAIGMSAACTAISVPGVLAAMSSGDSDITVDLLATVLEAKDITAPTKIFVDQQAYDKARYNIQFILNQLQLQKKVTQLMRGAINIADDENLLESLEDAGARITNTAIQYDSTVYTCVFIPTVNGEIPPSAEKYRKQASGYYAQFMADADTLLQAGTTAQLTAARELATQRLATYPSVLFKSTIVSK